MLRLCAADHGYTIKKLEKILELGADVNFRTPVGMTALHLACGTGKPNFIQLLLDAGADIEARDPDGRTALHIAILGSNKAIEILIDNGANMEPKDNFGKTPFYYACERGKVGAVKTLCNSGANTRVLTPAGTGMVGLMLDSMSACFVSNTLQMLRILIKSGADVNNVELKTGDTEVHKAAKYIKAWRNAKGSMEPIKILIRAGGDPWQKNNAGESAFHYINEEELKDLNKILTKYIKGNENRIVKNIFTEIELKAYYFNQSKMSKSNIYDMLRADSPAKKKFNLLKELPSKT